MQPPQYDVVIPTVARPSLTRLLTQLAATLGPGPTRVVVVDDRPCGGAGIDAPAALPVEVLTSRGRGPAAARNRGWVVCGSPWVVFLDDDVELTESWTRDLVADLAAAEDVAGVSGRIDVPVPTGRRPTDRERDVGGLAHAHWATADMAFRRSVLRETDGFDERFPRAYREDADLAIRVLRSGYRLTRGSRVVRHPVLPAPWRVSISRQRGNLDDALLARLHPPTWRERAGILRGRRRIHLTTTGAALGAVALAATDRPRIAAIAGAAWAASTIEFAARRIAAGPRDAREIATMLATSVAIPPAATGWWVAGLVRARRIATVGPAPGALLFDRDGTIVRDVPYNGDPERVAPTAHAARALRRARRAGMRVGIVTNQSGIGRGLLSTGAVAAVHARIEEVLGPFDSIQLCPHAPGDGCGCRKPRPGLVLASAAALGVPPSRCVVIGDVGADVDAAAAAGARGILVPTAVTRADEVARAQEVAPDLGTAVTWALGGSWRSTCAAPADHHRHGHVGSNGDATTSSRISTSAGAASA